MTRPEIAEATTPASRSTSNKEYPVREYIGGMAQELAEMARWDGDPVLAELLEKAALRADEPRP